MATPFDRLMETVRPYLPGAIDTAMKQQLFLVCQTFFRETNVWQENLPFTIVAGSNTADVLPTAGRIERLMWVAHASNNIPIYNATMPDTSTGTILMPNAQADDYLAQVALNVTDPISRDVFPIVPYDIMERYWQVIMDGLISNMAILPTKPYTNLQQATIYQSKFKGGCARARNENKELNTFNAQAWRFPQSFNRSKYNRR